MKNFGLIGACGYIAPRHLQAINDTGNKTLVAYDPMDSVGVLDRYSRDIEYFKTYEQFNYHIKTKMKEQLDFVSICSPNYLHKEHMLLAMELGADAICEKPLVTDTADVATLQEAEDRLGKRVYTILQLRHHQAIQSLRDKFQQRSDTEKVELDLTYVTSRGPWYQQTWKANPDTSGGIAANIGIHFFDMLTWIFGRCEKSELHYQDQTTSAGYMKLEKARVKWFLSIDGSNLPESAKQAKIPTYRSIMMEGEEIEFSGGFTDLHTRVYEGILEGKGYGLQDAAEAIKIASGLRDAVAVGINNNSHDFLNRR